MFNVKPKMLILHTFLMFYLCSTLCLTVSKSSVACEASACGGILGPRGLPICYNTLASTAPEVLPSPSPISAAAKAGFSSPAPSPTSHLVISV